MLNAHTVEQIRAAEAELMATLPPGELMQRAARGLYAAVLASIGQNDRVVALVGTGNNGADALFAAGMLRTAGVTCDVCLADADRVHEEGLAAARSAGARVIESPGGYDVVLDAVVGIGGKAGLRGRARQWSQWIDVARPTVVAVDLASGLEADSARVSDVFIRADHTVTFGTYKVSSLVDPAAVLSGGVPHLVDIGLAAYLDDPVVQALEITDAHSALEALVPPASGHKYQRGVVGIIAGSEAYAGAAHLCVAGAQAGTAGMVRFLGSAELSRRVVDRTPEVVASDGRVQAWAVGSGGGEAAEAQLAHALADDVPVVVDADALRFLPAEVSVPALLTPHAGELAEMMGVSRADIEADPLRHVEAAACQWGTTVLLKGRRTLIATPGRTTIVNLTGTSWLATAGAGDVLAGLSASFIASGAEPHIAGALAAYVHGSAAEHANPDGPFTASQVAATISHVIGRILASVPAVFGPSANPS